MWPLSVRASKTEDIIASRLARSKRRDQWRWWWQGNARQELAARDAADLVNEFGEDAYWLARICARQSPGAQKRQYWHAVATEIELRTAAMPATGKAGSLRAALDQQFAPRRTGSPRRGVDRASAPAGRRHDEHPPSNGRHHHASLMAATKEFDRHYEDLVRLARAARPEGNHGGSSDHDAAKRPHDKGWHDAEMHEETPRKRRRSGLVTALAVIGCTTIGTAGAYSYWTYYFGPDSTQTAPSAATSAQPSGRGAPSATTAPAAAGGYVVQVTAQRSRADAQAAFRSLQAKFPNQLGGRTAIVRRANLGDKGIYYRAVVGPFASAGEADQFCDSLKTAGGRCIIQRN